MVRRVAIIVLLIIQCSILSAQIGTWRIYMSYYEPQQIVKADNYLYVRTSNSLYQYNLSDHSITTFDKLSGLSDSYINHIAWNSKVKRLIIVYQNSNIDLLDLRGDVTNLSALYRKAMTENKTINDVYIHESNAYLATGFGAIKINMERMEISESYILNHNIVDLGISGQYIYAKNENGNVLASLITNNLQDPHNWTITDNVPQGVFDNDNSAWDDYLPTIQSLKTDGPQYNHFYHMYFNNGKLYSTGGGWRDGGNFNRPGCAQILNKSTNEWTIISDVKPLNGNKFEDVTTLVYDPANAKHFFMSTCGTGLYEFLDNQLVKNHTADNSPLVSALNPEQYPNSYANYVRVDGLIFDNDGKLWMSCSSESTQKDNILSYNPTTGDWKTYTNDALSANKKILTILRNPILDRKGYIWYVNDHHAHPCLLRIDPNNEKFVRYDRHVNQDDKDITLYYYHAVKEDLQGNIWVGTDQGLFMYTPEQQADNTLGFTQVKVPRNDGSDFADYLLDGVDVTAIAIDGANRKWIGTNGNGLYLISADNMKQIAHFTTENSKLLSDFIESLAINHTSGEVYIGTNEGLCSYQSDATEAVKEMDKDNVYAYPNPVTPDYTGLITVVGLTLDADVKIVSPSGKLIAEGRSNGGTFTWDGNDKSGNRVASGVYMVVTATSSGDKGTVCKIAIVR